MNDAPVLDSTGVMALAAIDENEITNPGTLVRDIVASAGGDRITDVDCGALEGIAVTAVDNTHGTWEYTLNNGRTWLAFGTPTATTARLLGSDAGTRIRFLPAPDWYGTVDPGLTFRAWDHTQGFNGQTADASTGGGAAAFSAVLETAAITVNPVAPIGETQIEMTIVQTPSAIGGNGEVATLPASRAWVHEWMPFWVEIWISTPDTTTLGVAQAAVDLQYNTAYLTATEIQYGPAFTQNLTGTIDDALGRVTAIGGATALTDVGDDAYVLLARVRFGSTGSDQVPVDEAGRNIGPYDMQLALANGQTQLVGGSLGARPGPAAGHRVVGGDVRHRRQQPDRLWGPVVLCTRLWPNRGVALVGTAVCLVGRLRQVGPGRFRRFVFLRSQLREGPGVGSGNRVSA